MTHLIKNSLLIFCCTLLVLSIYTPTAHAENWMLFYGSQTGEKYYFDKDSLERPQKKIVRVWQKKTRVEDENEQELQKLHLELDCAKKTYRIISIVDLDSKKNGAITEDLAKSAPVGMITFISIIGSLYENICQ